MLMHSMRNRNTEKPQYNSPNPFENQPRRRLSNKNKFIFIIAGAVVVIGVGVWLAWPTISGWFGSAQSEQQGPPPIAEVDEQTKRYLAVQDEATNLTETKGKEAAREFVDEKIAAADTNQEKAMLLVYKSTISSDVPGAPLQYAHEADELNPSFTSASALASYYELAGDNANALKYYKLMLERSEDDFQTKYPDDYASIQKKITFLENK